MTSGKIRRGRRPSKAMSCRNKKPHPTKAAALEHLRAPQRQDGAFDCHVYRCPYKIEGKAHWHVGHRGHHR